MKLRKILFIASLILTFNITIHANESTLEACKKAEISFLDMMENLDSSADQSFMGSLGDQVQISYYKMTLEKIDTSMTEVKKSCNGIASQEILSIYAKKTSAIEDKINSL